MINGVKILLVDDDYRHIFALSALLERGQANVVVAGSGGDAITALKLTPDIDIVLMDIMMPTMDGYETIRRIRAIPELVNIPIIAITGKSIAGERERCTEAGATDYVPKPVDSAALLTALQPWLTTTAAWRTRSGPLLAPDLRSEAARPERRSVLLPDSAINGRKILVVDDDFRNVFAMAALLERGRADVRVAESGDGAIAALELTPDMDIVLMDIMMPGMDGYETIRRIREIPGFATLPIIAVTGKVMAGERERCLDAGASAYVPKPVDTAALLAAITPWLPDPTPSPPETTTAIPGPGIA